MFSPKTVAMSIALYSSCEAYQYLSHTVQSRPEQGLHSCFTGRALLPSLQFRRGYSPPPPSSLQTLLEGWPQLIWNHDKEICSFCPQKPKRQMTFTHSGADSSLRVSKGNHTTGSFYRVGLMHWINVKGMKPVHQRATERTVYLTIAPMFFIFLV